MKSTLRQQRINSLIVAAKVIFAFVFSVVFYYGVIWIATTESYLSFGDYTTPTGEFIRGKTLWDVLELLGMPFTLTLLVFMLNRSERSIERDRAEERIELEREIATDRQREQELQGYLDRMTDLLLREKLRTSKKSDVRDVARIRTLTTLRRLDGERKADLLLFLNEAGLIDAPKPIIYLNGADLTDADLRGFNLSGTYLREVNLSRAVFHFANLENADLIGSKLEGAKFSAAILRGASVQLTWLKDAVLSNAIMPDGTKHD